MIVQAAFSVDHEFSPQSDLLIRPPLPSLPSLCAESSGWLKGLWWEEGSRGLCLHRPEGYLHPAFVCETVSLSVKLNPCNVYGAPYSS